MQRDLLEEATIDIEEEHEDLGLSRWPSSPPAVDSTGNDKATHLHELQSVAVTGVGSNIGDIQPPPKKKRRKRMQDDIDILFAGL